MNYINQFKLIHAITEHKDGWLNYKELLATVNRQQIMKKLQKSYSGLKGISDFFITEEPIEDENWLKLPERDKKKIAAFLRKFPEYRGKFKVIAGKEYRELEKEYKDIIPDWETYRYVAKVKKED